MIIGHVRYMNESLDRIGEFHIHPPFGNAGYDSLILLTDLVFHILYFFQLDGFPFRLFRATFRLTCVLRHFFQDRLVMTDSLLIHPSPQCLFDNPVNLQIRITADRRREMRIIRSSKSEMPLIFRGIFCLFHGT